MGISNKVFGVVKKVIFKRDSMIVVEYDSLGNIINTFKVSSIQEGELLRERRRRYWNIETSPFQSWQDRQ